MLHTSLCGSKLVFGAVKCNQILIQMELGFLFIGPDLILLNIKKGGKEKKKKKNKYCLIS